MTKEELIEKLKSILEAVEDEGDRIDEIMGTPIEDLDEVINGRMAYPKKDGIAQINYSIQDDLNALIDELKESA